MPDRVQRCTHDRVRTQEEGRHRSRRPGGCHVLHLGPFDVPERYRDRAQTRARSA